MRSGGADINRSYFRYIGILSHYWSITSGAEDYAYLSLFDVSSVIPASGPAQHYFGFSLRCLQE